MANGPEITVVVPAWDDYAGVVLAAAVRSLRTQGVPVELVLVDNASARPLGEHDGATIVRLGRRVSVGAARNAGLDRVRTPWVVFWDADDLMLSGTLDDLLRRASAEPRAVAVVARTVDGDTGEEYRWPRRWMRALSRANRAFAVAETVWGLFPTTGAALLRADAARAGGGFADADGGDDWAIGISLAFRGRVLFSDHPGRWYTRSSSSLSAGWGRADVSGNARVARARLRSDRGVPAPVRAATPLIGLAHAFLVHVLRPLLGRGRPERQRPIRRRSTYSPTSDPT
jgi:glycosyltransferase involved in cell wall biosynthesis